VAEDDPGIQHLLSAVLKREGYTVDIAHNGREAIERFEPLKYEAVLLDLMMPVMSGYEVLSELQRSAPEEIPRCIIVMTAVAERELKAIAGVPVFKTLRKPFDLPEVLAAIRDCSGRSLPPYEP
jgi:two-component system response regulator TrcR